VTGRIFMSMSGDGMDRYLEKKKAREQEAQTVTTVDCSCGVPGCEMPAWSHDNPTTVQCVSHRFPPKADDAR
jgi:uracil-DNA glycosylase